jgi:C4-dicarboxylate-specific signal transduction histidine kinase
MDILIRKTYDEMSKTAAGIIARMVRSKPDCVLGLATGKTPVGTYKELVRLHQEEGLENAVDFSEQGIIEISALNVEKSDKTIITFKDSGCGIPDKNMSRLFEPFFTTKEEAPGLGLTLAQSIIKNHGGEICIANNPDKGVSVTVHLYHVSKYPDQNQNP